MKNITITTAEEREGVLQIMSDLHKDVYGFRPRYIDYEAFTNEELADEYNFLLNRLDEVMEEERKFEAQKVAEFHSGLKKTMECANCDHVTALRYMFDAYISDQGFDYLSIEGFSYINNIAHTRYARQIEIILDRMVTENWDHYQKLDKDVMPDPDMDPAGGYGLYSHI